MLKNIDNEYILKVYEYYYNEQRGHIRIIMEHIDYPSISSLLLA